MLKELFEIEAIVPTFLSTKKDVWNWFIKTINYIPTNTYIIDYNPKAKIFTIYEIELYY